MKSGQILKVVSFVIVFVLLFSAVTNILTPNPDKNLISGFYEQQKGTLDAVYIGSSNCYAYWNPVLAWEEYGITIYPYSYSSQPLLIAEYLVKEVRKSQPDAAFIINVNTLGEDSFDDAVMHRTLDYMPFSLDKLKLTKFMAELSGFSFSESMEYYLPIIRYHDRWSKITNEDFSYETLYKGSNDLSYFLKRIENIEEKYNKTEAIGKIDSVIEKSFISLLDYCEKENVKVTFVSVPQARENIEDVKAFNKVMSIAEERGFPTIDLMNKPEEAGLDLADDFYNNLHTNVHGSIKFTSYISEYLIDTYNFEDKRENKDYADWNEALKEYSDVIAPYVIDSELDSEHRDYSLGTPVDFKASVNGTTVKCRWSGVEKADGYTVYRKTGVKGAWAEIATTDKCEIVDKTVKEGKKYFYTIVAFYEKGGENYYGDHIYNGVGITV